jgi:hypothetical protein
MRKKPELSPQELDDIVERLKNGDLTAMAKVNKENIQELLSRTDGDMKVEQLLRDWR